MKYKHYIGIDIGGTKIASALADERGNIRMRERIPTPRKASFHAMVQCLGHLIEEILIVEKLKIKDIEGIGIGVPGIVHVDEHRILKTPNANLSGMPLGSQLEKKFRTKVYLGNDVNLGLLGEQWLGAAKKVKNVIGLSPGTGIGGAIILDGKLFLGSHGAAAEIGHMVIDMNGPMCSCGNRGCLEALAGRWAIERDIRRAVRLGHRSIIKELSAKKLTLVKSKMLKKALDKKDPLITAVMTQASEALGKACISINHIFNPDMIVLGGGIIEACGGFMLPIIRKISYSDPFFSRQLIAEVVSSELGDDAVVLGAVALVKSRLKKKND